MIRHWPSFVQIFFSISLVTQIKTFFRFYRLLQLSFIGWYILGFIALFFGLLWVIAYVNVSIAQFYEQARIEKGSPMEYFHFE